MGAEKTLFCSVGTTSFDLLVKAVSNASFLDELFRQGFRRLVVQIGRGEFIPKFSDRGLVCSYYRFKPTLQSDMEAADLIVSHGGAGSIVEALRLEKPLVVVVNDALMDNHQVELASAMEEQGYLVRASCSTLCEVRAERGAPLGISTDCYRTPLPMVRWCAAQTLQGSRRFRSRTSQRLRSSLTRRWGTDSSDATIQTQTKKSARRPPTRRRSRKPKTHGPPGLNLVCSSRRRKPR